MKKSTNPSNWFKNDSIFIQLITSYTALYLLFFWGIFFIYFLSPEGDPLNKGEDGKGSWNLWTGLFLWLLSGALLFFKKRYSEVDVDNDPVLNKLDAELVDINKSDLHKLKKMQKEEPELFAKMVEMNLIDPNHKDFIDSNNEDQNDSQKSEGKENLI